jgi:procollagen-lysine,2-oxoglutarate 5-dioxygenase, invertebrate
MTNPCVLTVATKEKDYYPHFRRSCELNGIQPVILGRGRRYPGHGVKIKLVEEYVRAYATEFSHFIYVDAFDALFFTGLTELMSKFEGQPHRLVFSAERNCYPDGWKEPLYPDAPTPYRFLNSGFWMGCSPEVTRMFQLINVDLLLEQTNDQQVFTDLFLHRQAGIALDYACELCQSLASSEGDVFYNGRIGRVINTLTDQMPCVVHGNGNACLGAAIDLLIRS